MKTATFCGHRNIPLQDIPHIKEQLTLEIEKLINEGYKTFLLGGYGSFDQLAATTVKELQAKYPFIESILVIPYINRTFSKELYNGSLYPPLEKVPKKFAILKRNEYMIEKSNVVVSYVKYDWGGAATTLKYAVRKKKRIIDLADLLKL